MATFKVSLAGYFPFHWQKEGVRLNDLSHGHCRKGEIVVFFEPEPTNRSDPNALKVLYWHGRSRELRLLGYIARAQALNRALRECVQMAQFPNPRLFMSGRIQMEDLKASTTNPHTVFIDRKARHVPISVEMRLHLAHPVHRANPDHSYDTMRDVYLHPIENLQDFDRLFD